MIATPRVVVRLGTFTRRDITAPPRPSDPGRSAELQILRAWIEAEMDHPGDIRSVLAAVDSAVLRCLGQRQTSGQVADVYARVPLWMRPSLGLAAGEGLKRLLGRWDKHGAFQPADVAEAWRLTEEECAVYWWDIRGWTFREIQRELTPKGLRFDPQHWRGAEEVHGLLESARGKVRSMFGVGA